MNGNFKVRCIKDDKGWLTKGKIYEFKNGLTVFDNGVSGSFISNDLETFRCGNPFMGQCVEPYEDDQTIVIYTKGNETFATLKQGKEVIKTSKATCSPQDEFNFEYGAKLAVDRLLGTEKKEVKEVKRPAKVGEWVKATRDYLDEIKNGEIKQVKATYEDAVGVEGITKALGDGYWCLSNWEYVVLENYQPSTPTEIDYSTIDYTKLDGAKLFEEVKRRIEENGTSARQ